MKAVLASLAIIVIGTGFLWHSTDGLQALTAEGARRIGVAEKRPLIPDVLLETMSGDFATLHSADDKIVVAEFIYTTCPTICQTAGANLTRLRDKIITEGLENQVRILSVSFDPETDEPEQLTYYAERHNAHGDIWSIARPSLQDLPNLLKNFRVTIIPDGLGGYQHNAAMHILDSKGRLSAIVDIDNIDGAMLEMKKVLR